MAVRQESDQERAARKKLQKYFKDTSYEQGQFKGVCDIFLRNATYFQNGQELGRRLLEGQPFRDWSTVLLQCTQQGIRALVDDKNAHAHKSADELVSGTSFLQVSCP